MTYAVSYIELHAVDHCNHTCRWCHNYSPFAPQREYEASEYFEGLDTLAANGVRLDYLSIMGGEPFLHRNLVTFALDLKNRYNMPLVITTNGFWLSSENIRLYKALWPLISFFKFSRYPSIENRLGGEARIRVLLAELQQYNPRMRIDWPDKYHFNELAFFDEPVEPELYCFNVNCLALMTDMRIGHCGAGAYQHFAPEGTFSRGFLEAKHMFYDLRSFDLDSFKPWHKRYPLDACRFCNLSQKQRRVPWKPLKGRGLFRKDYERAFEYERCLEMESAGERAAVDRRVMRLVTREPEAADVLCEMAVARGLAGDITGALELSRSIMAAAPQSEPARRVLSDIAEMVKNRAS